jgi:hypothetical protein
MLFLGINGNIKIYRCPICKAAFNDDIKMYKHMEFTHRNDIPEGMTARQYCFNLRNGVEYKLCSVCKINKTDWNEKTCRYNLICNDPNCKQVMRDRFMENYKKKHGEDYDISDPEKQKNMMYARKIGGEYTFKDGSKIRYVSSYELDFLEFYDLYLGMPSSSIEECPIYFTYKHDGKIKQYIPDYYIKPYDLIVEIKSYENKHPKIQAVDKEMEILKDKAVIKDGSHNFIKVADKDYVEFVDLMKILRSNYANDKIKETDRIIIIPKQKTIAQTYKIPKINYIQKGEDLFHPFMKHFYSTYTENKIVLAINRLFVPGDYIDEELIPKQYTILRESITDMEDMQKVNQTFKEFSVYYTKKYEKYLDPDFLGVYHTVDSTKWAYININTLVKKNDLVIADKIVKNVFNLPHIAYFARNGIYILVETDKRENVVNIAKKIGNKSIYTSINDNLVPLPGTLHGNKVISFIDDYTTVL